MTSIPSGPSSQGGVDPAWKPATPKAPAHARIPAKKITDTTGKAADIGKGTLSVGKMSSEKTSISPGVVTSNSTSGSAKRARAAADAALGTRATLPPAIALQQERALREEREKALGECIKKNENNNKNADRTRGDKIEIILAEKPNEHLTDASKVIKQTQVFTVGPENSGLAVEFTSYRGKGSAEKVILKAMCEDFHIQDVVKITVGKELVFVPITGVLDGGGGHCLSEYGAKNFAKAFEKELQQAVNNNQNALTQDLIVTSLEKTIDQLFRRPNLRDSNDTGGDAYNELSKQHAEFGRRIGVKGGPDKVEMMRLNFKTTVKTFLVSKLFTGDDNIGEYQNLPPLKIYELLTGKESESLKKTLKLDSTTLTFNEKSWDLAKKEDAENLNELVKLALSKRDDITINANFTASMVEDKKVVNISVNRGDTVAFCQRDGDFTHLTHTKTNEVSHFVAELPRGSIVIQMCDGGYDSMINIENLRTTLSAAKKDPDACLRKILNQGSGDDTTVTIIKSVCVPTSEEKGIIDELKEQARFENKSR